MRLPEHQHGPILGGLQIISELGIAHDEVSINADFSSLVSTMRVGRLDHQAF